MTKQEKEDLIEEQKKRLANQEKKLEEKDKKINEKDSKIYERDEQIDRLISAFQSFGANLNKMVENQVSVPPQQNLGSDDDDIVLIWVGEGKFYVPARDGGEATTFSGTWDSKTLSKDEVKFLVGKYTRLFEEGLLVFEDKKWAKHFRLSNIFEFTEDKVKEMLELPLPELIEEFDKLSSGLQGTFKYVCLKRIYQEEEAYLKNQYKVKGLFEQKGLDYNDLYIGVILFDNNK